MEESVTAAAVVSPGTQELWGDDGDWGESEVREAGQVPADVRRVLLPGESKRERKRVRRFTAYIKVTSAADNKPTFPTNVISAS